MPYCAIRTRYLEHEITYVQLGELGFVLTISHKIVIIINSSKLRNAYMRQ